MEDEDAGPALPDIEELLKTPEDLVEVFVSFLETHVSEEMEMILLEPDDSLHYGLSIPFLDLLEANVTLAHLLQMHPRKLLPLLDQAIDEYQKKLLQNVESNEDAKIKGVRKEKPYCHARVCHLMPNCPDTTKSKLPRARDIGSFIEVRGTVIRTGSIKVLEWERELECARCKHTFLVHADPEQGNAFPKITKCPSGREPPCNSKNFKVLSDDETICRDYQEIKIQEQIQHLKVGSIPRSMMVILENDLVDTCKPGDDITVDGIVMRRWRFLQDGERSDLEMFIQANHIRVNNQQRLGVTITDELRAEFDAFWALHKDMPITARNIILQSICPQLYGMHLVKLAVALVLIGGVQKIEPNGLKVRGESHLLLIGDPGTGKSQFLKYAAKLSPRSVLTTGIGTTSAGLTVAAVKDQGGEWMLEAGALVLADGGVCCIDEFSSIRKNDKASILEAMEQQTLSVAKAGLVCKLRTETTVIAATNPKIKYDKEQSLSVNTALASPLLSRFDLILVLLDEQNNDWDRVVSHFILKGQATKIKEDMDDGCWPMNKLQAYISHVGKTFFPVLTRDAERVMMTYYKKQRKLDARNAARTTIRLLESMIRLAQAHSRLMYRSEVIVQDAVVAIQLIEISMQNSAILGVSSALHSSFPEQPEDTYRTIERCVLSGLGLTDLLDEDYEPPPDGPANPPAGGDSDDTAEKHGDTPASELSALSWQRRQRVSSSSGEHGGTRSVGASAFYTTLPSFSEEEEDEEELDTDIVSINPGAYPIGKPVKRKRDTAAGGVILPTPPLRIAKPEPPGKKVRTDGPDDEPDWDARGDEAEGAEEQRPQYGAEDRMEDGDTFEAADGDPGPVDGLTDGMGEGEDDGFPLEEGMAVWADDGAAEGEEKEEEEEVLFLAKRTNRKRFLD